LHDNNKNNVSISVIIAARNEENSIAELLESVMYQSYPRDMFEVIVIDDHSTDATVAIVNGYVERFINLKLLKLEDYLKGKPSNAYKKDALAYGVSISEGSVIVTTDADCVVGHLWLETIAQFYSENNAKAIAGPVVLHREKNWFHYCQSLDIIGLLGITASSMTSKLSYLSNGANMVFSKSVFYELNGYEDIKQQASGDDMMLIYKIAMRYPNDVYFLKNEDAAVKTQACNTLQELYQQRIRWATKNKTIKDRSIPMILGGVYLFNCVLFFYFFGDLLIHKKIIGLPSFVWVCKCLIDYFFLKNVSSFFNKSNLMRYFFIAQFFHVLFIITIGTLSIFKTKYVWKQRETS
jgi:cellulose synthase/poly-beta-1,6-N-acetylglucosamine synthase-like glycosyltransferase